WAEHFRMESFIVGELPEVIAANFPADMRRQSISGHSMGGHGALTLALKNPGRWRAVSAFAPICEPSWCPWCQKAFSAYFGDEDSHLELWRAHSAVSLIDDGARVKEILVDQGTADPFLETQLKPELLTTACAEARIKLSLRMQE